MSASRERLVEKAALADHQWGLDIGAEHAEWDNLPYSVQSQYRWSAEAVLDAILPLVTTPAELDGLPVNSKLLDGDGHLWTLYHHLSPAVDADLKEAMAKRLPLTLVWSPR